MTKRELTNKELGECLQEDWDRLRSGIEIIHFHACPSEYIEEDEE